MKKIILTFLIILMLGLVSVSASPLSEFMGEDVSRLNITINQNQSTINFYLNTAGHSWDFQNISYSEAQITFENVQVSSLLNSINFNLSLNNETPIFNSINIVQGTFLQGMMDFLFSYLHLGTTTSQINSNITILNEIIKQYNQDYINQDYIPANFEFSKSGNNYAITMDMGYGSVPEDYLNNIREIIKFGVYSLNTKILLENYVFPYIENYPMDFLSELDYNVSAVNLNNIKLEDGNYSTNIEISNGSETITKNIKLSLFGIVNSGTGTADNYTYVPNKDWIKEYINNISGLSANATFIFEIFDNKAGLYPPSNIESLKYFNITPSSQTSAMLVFKIQKNRVTSWNKVSLYVLENNVWIKLTTRYIGEDAGFFNYEADVPHFSLFMIGEDKTTQTQTTTTTSSGENHDDTSLVNRCTVGETKCMGEDTYVCLNYGYNWKLQKEGGCVKEEPKTEVPVSSQKETETLIIKPKAEKKSSPVGFIVFLVIGIAVCIIGIVWAKNKINEGK